MRVSFHGDCLPVLIGSMPVANHAEAADLVDWSPTSVPAVRLLLSQHTGAPARPTVAVGDRVRAGDLVGEIPEGKLGAQVHASIDGTVVHIDRSEIRIEER